MKILQVVEKYTHSFSDFGKRTDKNGELTAQSLKPMLNVCGVAHIARKKGL
jgi:hypothetical protein